MENSDFIISWVEDLKIEMNALPFKEDDIRKDFYGYMTDIAYCYYRSYLMIEVSMLMHKNSATFKVENIHTLAIKALVKNPISYKSHFNSLNRQLIVDAWSTFELCVNIVCENILNDEEKNKLLSHKFNDILKLIGKDNINESNLLKLQTNFVEEKLTHIAIVRKTDVLLKRCEGYSRNVEEDKKFLLFFGKLRNSMHSNFIYHGKPFEYTFGHSHFIFKDGESIKWYDPFKDTPKLYFHLIGNLKEIWKSMVLSIKWEDFIPYPYID